jgi:hypothetical protein
MTTHLSGETPIWSAEGDFVFPVRWQRISEALLEVRGERGRRLADELLLDLLGGEMPAKLGEHAPVDFDLEYFAVHQHPVAVENHQIEALAHALDGTASIRPAARRSLALTCLRSVRLLVARTRSNPRPVGAG